MKRDLIFISIIVIIALGGSLFYFLIRSDVREGHDTEVSNPIFESISEPGKTLPLKEISMTEKTSNNKKIAMVIAFQGFRDEEYFVPKEILESAGAEIKIASVQKGRAIGADSGEVDIDIL